MDVTWESICKLNEHILKIVHRFGFQHMMPVQVATIPAFMNNKDVCVEAVTGSGKTLSFIIPALEILLKCGSLKSYQVGALVISPTRELASQIFEVLNSFLDPHKCPFTSSLLIGGDRDVDSSFKGSNFIVGTPGRINAALEKCSMLRASIRKLEVLVLDEADQLLDLGFHKTLNSILSYLPKQRRTGLFSATQTNEVEQLVKAGMRNPVKITVTEKKDTFAAQYSTSDVKTPASLSNSYVICQPQDKFSTLLNIISTMKNKKLLIFFATCACVEYFGRAIKEFFSHDAKILVLHGKIRKKRLSIFNEFRQSESGILACTDVMARGIDIPDVDWVLQYDPPSSASAFVHRCGRTARVGRKGYALIFLLENEASYVDFIEINQKAPMLEYAFPDDQLRSCDWLMKLRELSSRDRDMYERGMRAFVSFVQSYSKHECSLIFRLKDIDFGALATGFGLLKMPKMPELRNKKITGFSESTINIDAIPYRDKHREKQRQEILQLPANERPSKPKYVPKKYKAFTEARKKKEKKKQKKEQKRLKKLKATLNDKEIEDLLKDAQMVKKLKRGKISNKEYDDAIEKEEEELLKEMET